VNESAGEQIAELLNGKPQLPATGNLDSGDESDERTDLRPAREGLPRNFRMRHDAHYVDELLSPRMGPTMTAPTQSGAPAALALIASRLESLVAHNEAIAAHTAGSSLVARSVQAEFARLARVARAAVVANDADTLFRRPVTAGEITDAVALAIAPIVRLGALTADVTVEDRAFTLHADAALVAEAIVWTVDATTELLQAQPRRYVDLRQPPPRVSVTVQSMKVRPAVIVDVTCSALAVSAPQAERFFENKDEDYRTTPAAGILLAAAAHVARAHGGRSDVKRNSGCATISFVYPEPLGDTRLA
jgi:hypothetical protein